MRVSPFLPRQFPIPLYRLPAIVADPDDVKDLGMVIFEIPPDGDSVAVVDGDPPDDATDRDIPDTDPDGCATASRSASTAPP